MFFAIMIRKQKLIQKRFTISHFVSVSYIVVHLRRCEVVVISLENMVMMVL